MGRSPRARCLFYQHLDMVGIVNCAWRSSVGGLQWHGIDSKRSCLVSISRLRWQNMTQLIFQALFSSLSMASSPVI